ncbi:hypothetical protein TIFTF001_008198 [Ficus carica]|uniref:Uncharacterized protein n=1 Tax=Ficus carica TaxID=3494 RepID=A0AA87ZUF1_FICCA|nr:hypothetical protein TIFTF001_008198 [Ficus carica]
MGVAEVAVEEDEVVDVALGAASLVGLDEGALGGGVGEVVEGGGARVGRRDGCEEVGSGCDFGVEVLDVEEEEEEDVEEGCVEKEEREFLGYYC